MRTLAIGDIHGCSAALDTLIQAVALRADDTVVTLGDYVDRGPDSKGVIERLIDLSTRHHLVALLGNHDEMMLEAREGRHPKWLSGYAEPTLRSYGLSPARLAEVPSAHWEFLQSCRDWYETEAHIFVHADVDPDLSMQEQSGKTLRWRKLDEETSRPHRSGKRLICGHSAQKSGRPLNLGHAVCIDTGAFDTGGLLGGWLTCLDVESGRVWMSSQAGELKTSTIEAFRA